jgi:hypothetical protein
MMCMISGYNLCHKTTNVFVANLPAQVSEPVLGNFFASKCGPVGSVSSLCMIVNKYYT